MKIQKLLVAGAGQMGAGIAQVAAQAGLDVVMIDVAQEFVDRGMAGIEKQLGRAVDKGRIAAEDRDATLGRIATGLEMAAGADADLFIEAAPETLAIKQDVLGRASAALRPEAIIATQHLESLGHEAGGVRRPASSASWASTSSTRCRPWRWSRSSSAGQTSDATVAAARGFCETVGKTPITVKDSPGFVVNRILFPMINEAVYALDEGVASAADIDTGLKLGANFPMGPLALADLVGLDTTKAILETLRRDLGDAQVRALPAARQARRRGQAGTQERRGLLRVPRSRRR